MTGKLSAADVCRVLQPVWDLANECQRNGPAGARLAELILPHTAADLTVGRLLELLEQVAEEFNP